jgi:hypothetical protein
MNLPWISALVISILTVIINYVISWSNRKTTLQAVKLEINSTVLSANRQVWINTLRDLISDYLAKCKIHKIKMDLRHSKKDEEVIDFINSTLEELYKLSGKIVLMLNSDEKESEKLILLLERFNTALFDDTVITQPAEYFQQEILNQTKIILKKEWIRVKKGQ